MIANSNPAVVCRVTCGNTVVLRDPFNTLPEFPKPSCGHSAIFLRKSCNFPSELLQHSCESLGNHWFRSTKLLNPVQFNSRSYGVYQLLISLLRYIVHIAFEVQKLICHGSLWCVCSSALIASFFWKTMIHVFQPA